MLHALDRTTTRPLLRVCFLVCLAFFTALLAITAPLELGIWKIEKAIKGPFPTEPGGKVAVVNVSDLFSAFCCVGIRSDGIGAFTASSLRAWLNDNELHPAHTAHADLQTGASRSFSHWSNHVYFRLPDIAKNDASAVLRVSFPVQVHAPLFRAIANLFGCWLALTIILFYPSRLASITSYGLHCIIRGGLLFFALFLAVYAGCFIYGSIAGRPLPAALIFHVWPVATAFNTFEPHFPLLLIILASAIVVLSWLRSDATALTMRHHELSSIRLWRWFGLAAVAGTFCAFIASGAWSGNVTSRDLPYSNIPGLVPNSDARGYFNGARYSWLPVKSTIGIFSSHWRPFSAQSL